MSRKTSNNSNLLSTISFVWRHVTAGDYNFQLFIPFKYHIWGPFFKWIKLLMDKKRSILFAAFLLARALCLSLRWSAKWNGNWLQLWNWVIYDTLQSRWTSGMFACSAPYFCVWICMLMLRNMSEGRTVCFFYFFYLCTKKTQNTHIFWSAVD